MKLVAILLGLVLLAGCASPQPRGDRLAIGVLTYPDREETVHLPNDYGFLIKWNDADPPEFYLYDRLAGRIRYTMDFSIFLEGLQGFPKRAKIDRISGCAAGFSWAMPADERRRLDAVITSHGFMLTNGSDNNFGICTCEGNGIRLKKVAD